MLLITIAISISIRFERIRDRCDNAKKIELVHFSRMLHDVVANQNTEIAPGRGFLFMHR